MFKKIINKIFYFGFTKEELKSIQPDIITDNRKCLILYSAIIFFGMGILLIASIFVELLQSSQIAYIIALSISALIFLTAFFSPKNKIIPIIILRYILILVLLAFGIYLGTYVEPNRASVSYGILLIVVPLLFVELSYRLNIISIISFVIYICLAKITQDDATFAFNLSFIIPYGVANLVLTHFTSQYKINKIWFAHQKALLSDIDQLTNLKNRRCFENDVNALIQGKEQDVTICSFDLNLLKVINDNFGHDKGDKALLNTTSCLLNSFGNYGNCYRTGGDEFIAIIIGSHPSNEELISSLKVECNKYKTFNNYKLAISCGIAEGKSQDIRKLIVKADHLMYKDKNEFYQNQELLDYIHSLRK